MLNLIGNLCNNFIDTSHNNETVIEKVKELRSSGIEVNVFIGKTPAASDCYRELPKAQYKEKWISLSLEFPDLDYYLDADRLHLVLDCNKSNDMQRISGLFDNVVIDSSVTKGFKNSALINIANMVALGELRT